MAFQEAWNIESFNIAVHILDIIVDLAFLLDLYLGFRWAILHDGVEERRKSVISALVHLTCSRVLLPCCHHAASDLLFF